VGKITLDIICDTAFGYNTDCLHNPANELAVAFEQLLDLQSGEDMARLIAGISIPGVAHLLASDWLYRHRTLVGKISTLRNVELLIDSMHRIRKVSREILRAKTANLSVPLDDKSTKQDIMSLIVRAHEAELDANPVAEVMSYPPSTPSGSYSRRRMCGQFLSHFLSVNLSYALTHARMRYLLGSDTLPFRVVSVYGTSMDRIL
jgi:hypothetical protein